MTSARSRFTLSSGRNIDLQSLRQWAVYAGLLEGLPTKERNNAQLSRLVEEAERRDGHTPVLITPVQEPIPYEERYPFGEPAKLPPIGCIARFHSHKPARDPSKDCSDLTIIWFQDDYVFPLSPEVERVILTLDWEGLARDHDY